MKITKAKDVLYVLQQLGWSMSTWICNSGADVNFAYNVHERLFFKYRKCSSVTGRDTVHLLRLKNLKFGGWEYDKDTGLIHNEYVAVKVKF